MSIFSERLHTLAQKQSKSFNQIEKDLKYPRNTFASYNSKNSIPSPKRLLEIAKYFQVSTDYLMGTSEFENINEQIINENEKTKKEFLAEIQNIYTKKDENKVIRKLENIFTALLLAAKKEKQQKYYKEAFEFIFNSFDEINKKIYNPKKTEKVSTSKHNESHTNSNPNLQKSLPKIQESSPKYEISSQTPNLTYINKVKKTNEYFDKIPNLKRYRDDIDTGTDLGGIAAGFPISDDKYSNIGEGETFHFTINGESMEPLIHDGTTVVCEKCYDVRDGEIAAVYFEEDNAGTLKYVYHETKNGKPILRLVSENEDEEKYPDIIANEDHPAYIGGRLVTNIQYFQ